MPGFARLLTLPYESSRGLIDFPPPLGMDWRDRDFGDPKLQPRFATVFGLSVDQHSNRSSAGV